jgi:hypothetical protein
MADEKPTDPDDQWDLDPFEDDASRIQFENQKIIFEFFRKFKEIILEA